ncbi:MAG: PAS domain-containing protein [Burkholderiaceae bacterium]|nr:PAS domain-containing protein [Burkholderiaceae bacterium]
MTLGADDVQIAWLQDPATDDLDATHARLALAAEAARIGLFERDLDTGAAVWDATSFALFGADPALGPPDRDALVQQIDPRDRERMREQIERLRHAAPGTPYHNEFRTRQPDGSLRHLQTRGRVLAGRDGHGRRLVGVMVDVSARLAAEQSQRTLDAQLQQVAEAAHVGLWRHDPASGHSEWNAQMYALTGIDPAQAPLSPQAALALVHPEDRPSAEVAALIEHGTPMARRMRLMLPGGGTRWVFVRARRIGGDTPHLAAVVVDITDLQLAEDRSARLAERLALAVASAEVGIWDVDLVSGEVSWNEQQYALMLRSPGEPALSMQGFLASIHADDRERVTEHAQAFVADGGRFEERFRVQRPDLSVIHVVSQAVAIKDASGRVVRIVGTNRDVTHEHRAATDRERLLKRLQLATRVANIGVWESLLPEQQEILDDNTCRMLGLGAGPQLRPAIDFLERIHPDDREAVITHQAAALAQGAVTAGPLRFRILRDGEERHLVSHYAIDHDASGKPQRVLGTVLDVTDLRRAEASARAAAERMEIATGLGGLGVFERDADDRFSYFDGVVGELYGLQPGQQSPSMAEGLRRVLAEDRDGFIAARARMRQTDAPVRCEYRAVMDDGRVRDILSWRRRRVDAQGQYLGEVGALMDITELRAAERRAREYAAWLSIATGSAGMGVWELGVTDRMLVADDQAHRLFDNALQPSPASLDRLLSLIDPADRERVSDAVAQAVAAGRLEVEYRINLPAGGMRTIAARGEAHRDAQGQPVRIIGVVWDISARRAAEDAARAAAERLQLAALGAGLGCWERSFDGRHALWDAQMFRLFGATPADGAATDIFNAAIHAEDAGRVDAARQAAGGGVQDFIGVAWDVTEARVTEAALRAKETAERASHAKSEFLSRMSHELRTPLNAIVGFTQLLELDHDDPLSATQRERVGLIRSSGWHLLNLMTVSMEVVSWRPVLEDALAMVQTEATARGIVLETRSTSDVPVTVWGDPVRLRQVLLNLLSNAVKYNRDHGSVQVTVRADSAAGQGGHVVFSVRDSGRGMSTGQMDRLFQPFNRLGVDASAPAGTGIGLAISQRLMQQMEGAIEVDSRLGVGSEFRVRLRAARVEVPRAITQPANTASTLAMREDVAGTLLYIEDNPANSALVEQFLHFRPRVKLYQAADGATGLVMAAVCQPDLILIDIRLPDMMSDEVLKQLRLQPETREIACVAVSANAMPHDIESALAAGFADYWTKPLDVARFLRGIDERLGEAAARRVSARGDAA